jgi:hypothetical protein
MNFVFNTLFKKKTEGFEFYRRKLPHALPEVAPPGNERRHGTLKAAHSTDLSSTSKNTPYPP